METARSTGFKRPCPVLRDTSEKAKKEEKYSRRKDAILKHAPKIAELAEKALVALQELIAAESVAKHEIDEQYSLFCSDENTLEDAELAIVNAKHTAESALEKGDK